MLEVFAAYVAGAMLYAVLGLVIAVDPRVGEHARQNEWAPGFLRWAKVRYVAGHAVFWPYHFATDVRWFVRRHAHG